MSRTFENAEELFRFASTRAPSDDVPLPAGLLRLTDESDVAHWLASAPDQDFTQELLALEARWQTLAGRDADAVADYLRLGSSDSGFAEKVSTFALVHGKPSQDAVDALLNSLWKYYLQGLSTGAAGPTQLKRAQQLMGQVALLQSLAGGESAPAPVQLQGALDPRIKLPAAFEAQLARRRGVAQHASADDASAAQRRQLQARLAQLEDLERRLSAAIEQPIAVEAPLPSTAPVPAAKDAVIERTYHLQPAADPAQLFRVANDSLLHELDEAQIASAGRSPYQLLDMLRREMAGLVQALARLPVAPPAASPSAAGYGIRPVGVADLRVVKQVLLGYEKGELANIHNIVHGETLERRHSQLQRTDEGQSDWSQRDSEQTRENQTYDRFEMGQFAYTASRESQDSNSSISISGTYGDVQYQVSTFMGSSRGRDETRGEDLRRSREVVERAVQLTRESVGQSRWRNVTSETQDTTIHKQKAKCGHVITQYRWVDKVYQAQVFNYGARAMYEVMVPSPAALFKQLLVQQPGNTAYAGPAPVKPALRPSDFTDATWQLHAERHGVALPAPPVAAFTEYGQAIYHAGDPGPVSAGGEFKVESGYEASIAGCSMSWVGATGQAGITASIGTLLFSSSLDGAGTIPAQAMGGETGEVAYGATSWGAVDQYTVNFYLVWKRTRRALEQWQLACHQAVMDDYERKLAAHREQQAAALTEQQMRSIERTELKRAVLDIVRGSRQVEGSASPEAVAREVRFFEHAFEWDQMTYRLHPYFWATQDGWSADAFGQQGDAVFTAFLNAGFATVILPVRKGYEDAAAVYLQTGLVLELAVAPFDDAVATMNREVALINAAADDGVSEGEAWTYRIPTTLTVLDEGSSGLLPSFDQER